MPMKKRLMRFISVFLSIAVIATLMLGTPVSAKSKKPDPYAKAKDKALNALLVRANEGRERLYVYKDYSKPENHFTTRQIMYWLNKGLVKDLDEEWKENPYSGTTCIRCEQDIKFLDWGGYQFLNGYLPQGEVNPQLNTGEQPGQGLDLTGADALHFYARGENGGEMVEFFTFGFGYSGETNEQLVEYPDSSTKISLGWVELTKEWKEYVIPLDGVDMSYIICGFGYVLNNIHNDLGTTVFYLDEIYYSGKIKSLQNAPMLLQSYNTDNPYLRNTAFSYDNALVAMAFMSEGKKSEAKKIVNSFLYAINNDRSYSMISTQTGSTNKRVRNAYASGDISSFPGWGEGARISGWYDNNLGIWCEDQYQVGSNVGNTSYVSMALLQYYRLYGGKKYLKAACSIMDWVIKNCSDGQDGFTAGFDGWEEADPPVVRKHTYRSTEHNIDAYCVFKQLAEITKKSRYKKAAASSKRFIDSMYDKEKGIFHTGTTFDGETPNKEVIALDVQVWSALALGDDYKPYEKALDLVASMQTKEGGYPFCERNENGGYWAEGTAFTALMYRLRGDTENYKKAMDALLKLQAKGGLFRAASVKHLSTGIYLYDGKLWEYSKDLHIAPTAYMIMAANGFNPYDFS